MQRWWFGISVPLTIATRIPAIGNHLPTWLGYILLLLILFGLVVGCIEAYSRAFDAVDELEERFSGAAVGLASVTAGEYVSPIATPYAGAPLHSVVIDFRLVVRNRDGQAATTVELRDCTLDVASAVRIDLGFAEPLGMNKQPPLLRTVEAGTTREVSGGALFELPFSQTHIPERCVHGEITLLDTRGKNYKILFTAELIKNPVGEDL